MAAGVEVMEADLVEDSMAEAEYSTAGALGGITEASVEVAGVAVGAVMAGVEAGVGTAGAAGVGVIPAGVGELALALVGAGVPIGRVIPMRMAILTMLTPTIRLTRIMGRTRMRQRTWIGITVAIRGTTRSSKILSIQGRRDRLA
jgi:Kef-type K+ transport system membrane component KefB